MKFSEYAYQRPDVDQLKVEFKALLEAFKNASSATEQSEILAKYYQLDDSASAMQNICYVRHSIDTTDKFYEEEVEFFNTRYPELSEVSTDFYKALLASPFRAELEAEYGKHLFVLADLTTKVFEPAILDGIIAENKLDTEYRKIKAQAKIDFEGKTYNLSTIEPLEVSADRNMRKKASEAKWAYYAQRAAEVEAIYDKLVKTRTESAQKLGFENFIPLGYARMRRSDYDAQMVANFREQIVKHIVPITQKLYKSQAARLGLDSLKYYDEGYKFKSGNPTPKGNGVWMEAQAKQMYSELSKETEFFFNYMSDGGLMDLESKDGKETGGYCTFIGGDYQSPFIFSNFNGTSHDVTVLTHEAGHAFQCFETSRQTKINDYLWPTYEACEIHSMSMEFLTWPWMNLFFQEDTEKFFYEHLAGALRFLPYGCAVDEFQHIVYENPNMTTTERNAAWSAIEKKYLPHRDYDGNEFLENGGFWQKQGHIFSSPFYYIDYVLAQICAFQFWIRAKENKEEAWKDYVHLCRLGGKFSFLDLVKEANLESPFDAGCIEKIVAPIAAYLDGIDDSKF